MDYKYNRLHNDLRYPNFNKYRNNYTNLKITEEDCILLKDITNRLELYLNELYRI